MLEYSMNDKLLTKNHLEIPSLKGGCAGSSESIYAKMPHCWKSHVPAKMQSAAVVFSILRPSFHGQLICCILQGREDNISS